jgi:type IX secretion system PorP/SprF family membrane protein
MRKYIKITAFAFVIIILTNVSVKAQDAHLSQFDALPVLFSPALTGNLSAQNNIRAGAQFRSQWGALSSNITSVAFAVDAPLNERWGVGGYMINSQQSEYFNSFSLVLSGAYRVTATDQNKHFISVGLQAGIILKALKDDELVFDSQYSNGNFDPDLPSGESFARSSKVLPEINMGIYYGFTDPAKKVHPYLGFSVFHATSPNESFFYSSESHLPRKWVLNTGCNIDITKEFYIEPKVLYMIQLNNNELVAGMNFNYSFKEPTIKVMAGAFYRSKDAVIVQAGINYKNLNFIMSYDINTSSLNAYSYKRGGLEFSIVANSIGEKRYRSR